MYYDLEKRCYHNARGEKIIPPKYKDRPDYNRDDTNASAGCRNGGMAAALAWAGSIRRDIARFRRSGHKKIWIAHYYREFFAALAEVHQCRLRRNILP